MHFGSQAHFVQGFKVFDFSFFYGWVHYVVEDFMVSCGFRIFFNNKTFIVLVGKLAGPPELFARKGFDDIYELGSFLVKKKGHFF